MVTIHYNQNEKSLVTLNLLARNDNNGCYIIFFYEILAISIWVSMCINLNSEK